MRRLSIFIAALALACACEGIVVTPTPQEEEVVTIKRVALDYTRLSLKVGEEFKLNAIIVPAEAKYESISWSSSDEQVATVDQSGKVVAVKEGNATITVTVDDKTAECQVTVDYIHVTSVSISQPEASLYIGDTVSLSATVNPNDATYPDLSWSSSNPEVATVSEQGLVTAISEGTAVITASADGCSANCSVKVDRKDYTGSGSTEDIGDDGTEHQW